MKTKNYSLSDPYLHVQNVSKDKMIVPKHGKKLFDLLSGGGAVAGQKQIFFNSSTPPCILKV